VRSIQPVRLNGRPHPANQKGFTLIELLVVISILGVLAALVSMSLVGITTNAKTQANKTEQETVQTAFDAMVQDQTVDPATICPSSTTNTSQPNDLSTWPTGHPLYPAYIRQQFASQPYSCTTTGQITSP
jgi:prepilin-type N-terminal cleavage/methylation domain-containing protein